MKREDQFILLYKDQWYELEKYIEMIKEKGYSHLTNDELKAYLNLTKKVSHHLALAKTYYKNSEVVGYLNDLLVQANNNLYIVKGSSFQKVVKYIRSGFPLAVHQHRNMMMLSTIIFTLAMIFGGILVMTDKNYAAFFLPETFLQLQDWSMEQSAWEESQFFYLSSLVMINNIGVAIKVFAFGIIGGVVTAYILFINGAMLGALTGLVHINNGNMLNYLALILPHGIFELSAIVISGGAGLIIGKSLLIPGPYRRIDAIIKASKEAAVLIPGIVMMLVLAGLIEGFVTPFRIEPMFKLGLAGITFIILILYFRVKKK